MKELHDDTDEESKTAQAKTGDIMLFTKRVVESIGLKVTKPMILLVDDKGAKDLMRNSSVGGRARHVNICKWFLRDLKEEGIIEVRWIAGNDNSADLLTKNLQGPLFEKHAKAYVGDDEYMKNDAG